MTKKTTLKFDEIGDVGQFMYLTSMQLAIKAKEVGFDEKMFLEFCKEIWASLNMNDINQLKEILNEVMIKQIKQYVNE